MEVDPILADFARGQVSSQLGHGSTISHVEALQVADQHAVLLLTLEGWSRRLVLKVASPDDTRAVDYQRTATVTTLAQAAGAPVPAVLAVDTSYRAGPWRYLLLEHVEGVEWRHVYPLLDEDEVRSAHRQIATALLAIQSIHFHSFGELDGHASPVSVSDDLLNAVRERAALRIADEHARSSFDQLLDREAGLFSGQQTPTLSHDDLHHANLIFGAAGDSWQLAGVLDWDKAWAGPAESDVARMAFWDDMTGPGFWEVYRAAVPQMNGQPERILIYQLLWCLEYNDTSARHLADTNALRHQLRI